MAVQWIATHQQRHFPIAGLTQAKECKVQHHAKYRAACNGRMLATSQFPALCAVPDGTSHAGINKMQTSLLTHDPSDIRKPVRTEIAAAVHLYLEEASPNGHDLNY